MSNDDQLEIEIDRDDARGHREALSSAAQILRATARTLDGEAAALPEGDEGREAKTAAANKRRTIAGKLDDIAALFQTKRKYTVSVKGYVMCSAEIEVEAEDEEEANAEAEKESGNRTPDWEIDDADDFRDFEVTNTEDDGPAD
jgi:uncharacterized membrane protein YkoI